MVTVGIDPHKKTHTAVLIGEDGRQRGAPKKVKDEPASVGTLVAWASRLAAGEPIRWAIEDGRGLARRLADALVWTGTGPVCWVPVRLMAGARRRGGQRGKSDPIDALAVAKAAANEDNARWLAPHSTNEPGRDLRSQLDAYRHAVAERTRLINTIRWDYHRLTSTDAPTNMTTLKAPRELAAALQALAAGVPRDLLIEDCQQLLRLTVKINRLTKAIDTATGELCPNLRAIVGVGPITAAIILGELGDPSRVRNSAAFARMSGVAPIPVNSANTDRKRLDRGGNRQLNYALHTAALTQARCEPRAQALIARTQPSKGERGAMRILKRHLADIVYKALMLDINALTSQHAAA